MLMLNVSGILRVELPMYERVTVFFLRLVRTLR